MSFAPSQRLLGHKTHAMTQRRARHYPESLRNAVKVLETAGYDTNMTQSAPRRREGGSQVIKNWSGKRDWLP